MKKGFKKFLTVLLAVAMICSFSVTAFAAEGGEVETNKEKAMSIDVSRVSMFKPLDAKLVSDGEEDTLMLQFDKKYQKAYLGSPMDAAEAKDEDCYANVNGWISIPATEIIGQYVTLSYYTKKWYSKDIYIDKENGKVIFDNTAKSIDVLKDAASIEEAVKIAKENACPAFVNKMIDAIYVQVRDENTDKYCAAAKAAWDALTDEDKELVTEGDYFGRDTGDASKDNPRNQDNIGEKELLVVSFGTSFNDSRVATIGGIENALEKVFPEYSVRRAFTAQIIINHIQSRDGEVIDNMDQALERAVANGVKELVVQPTHLMHGYEYDEMCEALKAYEDKFDKITISEPLLNTDADKDATAKAIFEAAAKDAGYKSMDAAAADKETAFVFMGHGTSHAADGDYTDMQNLYKALGYNNVFIATVEGDEKEEFDPKGLTAVKEAITKEGYKNVILRPLMVVAGDHANNDMADEEDEEAFAGAFIKDGFKVTSQIKGLGEIEAVQNIYVAHATCAILGHSFKDVVTKATDKKAGKIENTCENCGTVKSTKTIYKASKITLSKTAYTYNGSEKKPVVTVKDSKGNKIAKSNYTVSYKNNKKVGKATVTITLKGNYKGTVKKTFKINPKGTTATVAAGEKSFKVTIKKQSVQTTGYQIRYSAKSTMANAKTVTVSKNTTLNKTVKNLKAGQKYYVQVRTYKTVNKVKYVSDWSKAKVVTTK